MYVYFNINCMFMFYNILIYNLSYKICIQYIKNNDGS